MKHIFASTLIAGLSLALGAQAQTTSRYHKAEQIAKDEMNKFDNLDFDYFSNQKWDMIQESHADNIKVYWPDGHMTEGIERHIEDLKAMFVAMPDLQVVDHPIRIVGSNVGGTQRANHPTRLNKVDLSNVEWTTVIGTMHGTFSKPMPTADGKFIEPTNKSVTLRMVTVGHWTKAGKMDEEYLFWDDDAFMKQLGLR